MMTLSAMSGPYWTGCDLGGHLDNTTEPLLVRFFQLGAWTYTYFREHNTIESAHREPFLFHGDTYRQLVKAINDRYSMIAVWYTCTISSRWTGRGPVVPLWFEWPEVLSFHTNEIICLLADSLLVAPVTESDQKFVNVVKPPGIWYDFWTGRELVREENVSVTMWDIPVFIRGGRIIPWYAHPVNTTIATVVTPLTLYVAENDNGTAFGTFYMDDGVTFNASVNNIFVHRHIHWENGELSWTKSTYPVTEAGVPDLLKNAIVEGIVFYSRRGVSRVVGLSLPICDTWVWHKSRGDVLYDSSVSRGSSAMVIGIVAAVVSICLGAVIVAVKLKKGRVDIGFAPLLPQ
jgi:alpha-glucosidase (family GH31 glycosyl hydrolase)